MSTDKASDKTRLRKRRLVQSTAEKMRDMVLAKATGAQIGSLSELARELGVGIVTVQQAARVLEHQGLLEVRRGPGGGYYGARPDEAALERALDAYLIVHGGGHEDATEMHSLLVCELVPAAARCTDPAQHQALQRLSERIDGCDTRESRVALEGELHDILYKMVNRPLIELLARVTTRHYRTHPIPVLFPGADGVAAWKDGRRRILNAILARDEALARFEALRYREDLLERLRKYVRSRAAEDRAKASDDGR